MKRILSLLLTASIMLSMTACGNTAPSSQASSSSESSTNSTLSSISSSTSSTNSTDSTSSTPAMSDSSSTPATTGEIKITDHLKREVIFEKPAEKIVSGYYITSSLLISLGLSDKVVGIEEKAKARPIYSLAAKSFLDLANVGSAKNFNLEGCIALKPDLVILPMRLKDTVKTLEDMGIKVIAVNPEDETSLKETIQMISTVTNTKDKGDKLIKYIDDKKAMLADSTTKMKLTKKPTVYVAGNSDYLSTATKKMYQSSMVGIAGGVSVSDDIDDTYWATISPEQLITYNPDIIIIVPFASYKKDDILKDEKLKGLTAVKNNAVYAMPSYFEAWDSPVPSSILGSMWLHSILFEKTYSFDTFKTDASGFYKEFYNIEINKDDLTK